MGQEKGKIRDCPPVSPRFPINDVWIAAHAIETGSVLITFDTHFGKIGGIRLWHHLGS